MKELIKCESLSIGYEGKEIVKDINFQVNEGDYLLIIGANGKGKTTLMKAILGLNKQISGTITYDNGLIKTDIGYLPQQTIVQKDFPTSIYEVVLSGALNKLKNRLFYSKKEKDLVNKNLKLVGLYDIKKKSYKELSGGQQQRVLLARALTATDKLLLLDEPVTGLDPDITKELYEIIYKLNKENNLTIIMITHNVKDSIPYATHILSLDDNFFGTKEEYLSIKGDM
jgi:zinc transport system ATP-binding protein